MASALVEAERLGLDCLQVFTKNQQQWKVRPLEPDAVTEWKHELDRLGWHDRIVSHASYLINLASPDDALWEKSIDLMGVEIDRCEDLAIPFLVHHPGSSTTSSAECGLERIAQAYKRLLAARRELRTILCLENTVGSGSHLGRTFEELAFLRARIIELTDRPDHVACCIDTCHAHAGGYDLATRESADSALRELERHVGLRHVRVLHMNDSKGAMGSRLDRHAHIGEGTIGNGTSGARLAASGFGSFMNNPALAGVPKILETPKEDSPKGTPMDQINARRLRRLTQNSDPAGRSGQTRRRG